ncbi:MAG TPA: polysaccharide biosynthesis/export family protein [Pirellulales bacterium]|jgi:polysaccharide export outer membrane protein|nr:polysaccharide biosynthesis/export family protein [Pirellulales bacterium]
MPAVEMQCCRHRTRWLAAALALAVCGTSGCGGARIYKAADLPTQYLAAGVDNVHTLDLSKLAGHAAGSMQIGPGDVLQVAIETGYSDQVDSALARVADDGEVSVPLVGRIRVAGLEPEEAERAISAAAIERGVYRNPTVTLDIKRQRTNRVTVIGAVENPDVYELPRGSSSLLAALVAAGGLSANAATTLEVRHAQPVRTAAAPDAGVTAAGYQAAAAGPPAVHHVNLVEAARQEHNGFPLADGDVVVVEKRDAQPFDVLGLVTKPGRFELPANKDIYLLDALAMAGGVTTPWADKAHLIRPVAGQREPVVVDISIRDAKEKGVGNLRLGPGDVVSVEQTPRTLVTGALRAIAPYSVTAIVPFIR